MKTGNQQHEESKWLRRVLLVQIIPFALMLVISSWLTLQAGQLIEQQRSENVKIQLTQF